MKIIYRLLKGIVFIFGWTAFIMFVVQDALIFPSSIQSKIGVVSPPSNLFVERIRHRVVDGTELEVWRLPATNVVPERKHLRALILHGNGGSLEMFFSMQQWMASEGIVSYSFDYRGTGNSTGWPSEKGVFLDAISVFELIVDREKVLAKDIIVIGQSIGTGFAAGLASVVKPSALVLFSPYQSIPAIVEGRPLVRYLKPLLRYNVDTESYIKNLQETCILITHGDADNIIPISHSDFLAKDFGDNPLRWYKRYQGVGHNELFFKTAKDVGPALFDCLEKKLKMSSAHS